MKGMSGNMFVPPQKRAESVGICLCLRKNVQNWWEYVCASAESSRIGACVIFEVGRVEGSYGRRVNRGPAHWMFGFWIRQVNPYVCAARETSRTVTCCGLKIGWRGRTVFAGICLLDVRVLDLASQTISYIDFAFMAQFAKLIYNFENDNKSGSEA